MSHPLIILEGPDGAGKSTFAARIANRFITRDFQITHQGPPPAEVNRFLHYRDVLDRAMSRPTGMDRWAPGELVYGPIYRGEDKLGWDGWCELYRLTLTQNPMALFILCLPPYQDCRRAWASGRKELLKNEVDLLKSYGAYRDFLKRARDCGQGWVVLDYTFPGDEERVLNIVKERVDALRI